eukprot:JP446591.1.p1 GENE.JP446591.1~~JP446591.1.p1  ORF type:complete len:283 (-),score=40.78 JP446591.1:37-885(-)
MKLRFPVEVEDLKQRGHEAKLHWIIDCYSVHKAKSIREYLATKSSWLCVTYIAPGLTPKIQVCDLVVNYTFKHVLTAACHEHLLQDILKQYERGAEDGTARPDTKLSTVKPHLCDWLHAAWSAVGDKQKSVQETWASCGFSRCWKLGFQRDALDQISTLFPGGEYAAGLAPDGVEDDPVQQIFLEDPASDDEDAAANSNHAATAPHAPAPIPHAPATVPVYTTSSVVAPAVQPSTLETTTAAPAVHPSTLDSTTTAPAARSRRPAAIAGVAAAARASADTDL